MTTGVEVATEMVQIPRRGRAALPAYLAQPEGAATAPGVVIIHEIFGLNDNIQDIARRFAREGYIALAVDLFAGSNRALCLIRLLGGLTLRPLHNGGLDTLRGSIRWLQQQPRVDRDHVGVIGFCMGGGYALALACVEQQIKAVSAFYGQNPRPLSALARACPIAGSYPALDPMTRGAAVKLERALERYQVPHDIKTYPGAKHSFFNDMGGAYHPQAAADSWERTLAFFGEHLGAETRPAADLR